MNVMNILIGLLPMIGEMGVSRTMPVSTGFQLIGTSLWGGIVLVNGLQ